MLKLIFTLTFFVIALSSCSGTVSTAKIEENKFRIRSFTDDSIKHTLIAYQACYRGKPIDFRNSVDLPVSQLQLVVYVLYENTNVGASPMASILTIDGNFESGKIYQLMTQLNDGKVSVWAERVDSPSLKTTKKTKDLRFSQFVNFNTELRPLCRT